MFASAGLQMVRYQFYLQPRRNIFRRQSKLTQSFFFCSNIAEALVSKGLVKVVRHRQDDDSRSAHYDDLLAAEQR